MVILNFLVILLEDCTSKSEYYLIEYKDSIDLLTRSIRFVKEEIIINDSIIIGGNTFQIKNIGTYLIKEKTKPIYIPSKSRNKPSLYDLDGPYHIFKEVNNDTIMIIKNQDTLYFNIYPLNKEIGGLRAGIKNATWPFASLSASGVQLGISSIYGTYKFSKDELLDIQPYVMIPLVGQGIKISHTKKEYPSQIIFWYFGNLEKLIKEIKTHLNETK